MSMALTSIGTSQSKENKQKKALSADEMFAKHRLSKEKGDLGVQKQFDNHIKLMCAYAKNRSPNDNADPEKFMQSTFQMLNTEQIILMNKLTSENQELQKRLAKVEEGKLVNREVKVETEAFVFDDASLEFEYELPQKINNPVFEIYAANDLNKPIHQLQLNPDVMSAGIIWNGTLENGEKAPSGEYVMKVSGTSKLEKNSEGKPLKIYGKTSLFTVVDYVPTDTESKEQFYVSGKMLISEKDIRGMRKKIPNPYEHKKQQVSSFSQTDEEYTPNKTTSSNTKNDTEFPHVSFPSTMNEHERLAQQTLNTEV
ncbi:MAG: hypothetical protein HEEMFOPI_01038 [Holosporales bacterium]